MVQAVSDIGSNANENIAHSAKIIGRSKQRRAVFDAIYTGKRRIKKVSELMQRTKLPHRRVLDAGKKLADNRLVKATKVDSETAYEKIDFFHQHKRQILSLASCPAKLNAFPTKRNPAGNNWVVRVQLSRQRASTEVVTIDNIDSFRRVRTTVNSGPELSDRLSETQFKRGLQRIIGEGGKFKDWGGEVADLFTSRLRIKGRRYQAALALKGPSTKGKLTPGKMGKNGDQIQRLFEAPATVFFVQYCRQIDQAVLKQMEQLAIVKSLMTQTKILYGIVDGQDSWRLMRAYPKAFDPKGSRPSHRS